MNTRFAENHRAYFLKLHDQGNVKMCPSCFENGERLKEFCCNPVLMPEGLVCCYFGNKEELTKKQFKEKIKKLKAHCKREREEREFQEMVAAYENSKC